MKLTKIHFTVIKVLLIWKNVDIQKVLVSSKISFGGKNYNRFTGYLHNDNKVRPLHIMLPTTSAYVKSYDGETKYIYFLTEDDNL